MPKNVLIIGSTGSIGTQALDVINKHSDDFSVAGLSAYRNQKLLDEQIAEFKPKYGGTLKKSELESMITQNDIDLILFACRGTDLTDLLKKSIKLNKNIAIANKEMIVENAEEIMSLVKKSKGSFVPVDSEHNAIFQIMQNRSIHEVEKIILTCSGGPFWNRKNFDNITVEQALNHPKWNMGSRITIDSATLMNKAIEIIEARYLFDLDPGQIEVLIHPECIVHGIVCFKDGSSIAHTGAADMRLPIFYALNYPHIKGNNLPRVDFKNQTLSFYEPDTELFPSIKFAHRAIRQKKEASLLKANQKAVEKFLNGEIEFKDIFKIVEKSLQ
jgi:1-deoxy-D-xylulose-5-phosphate reductoisomerase